MMILPSQASFSPSNGRLSGEQVNRAVRRLKDLRGLFADEAAFLAMDPEQIVYEVHAHDACGPVEGGLFFGVSTLFPGKVGQEYFMTKGHIHERRNRGEYYWGIEGRGALVTMNERREATVAVIEPGSLHYVPGNTAHRIANTGNVPLVVGACWPADAGHDYDAIAERGFPVRIVEENGAPVVRNREDERDGR
ncbi:glucose-6-phosphate isomerase family protein [Cohnella hongkongensis]|uniref:glucose-6-phosphate isomerase n=1 Tax=Cohnella hongkongensis TaxID=178337 RepID=A0ABV9FK96_9BACL